jgi:hypothetical protein
VFSDNCNQKEEAVMMYSGKGKNPEDTRQSGCLQVVKHSTQRCMSMNEGR